MSARSARATSHQGPRCDVAFHTYLAWRGECDRVWDAYTQWAHATTADAGAAFRAYSMALDREGAAAAVYAGALARAGHATPEALTEVGALARGLVSWE
jgi:hypothetical protein